MTVETSLQQQQPIEPLTPREKEVLRLLANFELEYSDIASNLNISRATVHAHAANIFQKLLVSDRALAVVRYCLMDREYREWFIAFLS